MGACRSSSAQRGPAIAVIITTLAAIAVALAAIAVVVALAFAVVVTLAFPVVELAFAVPRVNDCRNVIGGLPDLKTHFVSVNHLFFAMSLQKMKNCNA